MKQMQLEKTAMKNIGLTRTFKTHPQQLFECDSDTSTPCTPRIKTRLSSSTSNLADGEYLMQLGGRITKQKDFQKYLHEKPPVTDSNPSEHSESSCIADCLKISHKSETISGFQSNYHVKSSRTESTLAASFFDTKLKYTTPRCKNYEFKRKNNNAGNDISAAEKMSAGSRPISQQSYCPRGISLSVFRSKFNVVVTKCLRNIAEIRETIAKGIEPPDGEEDESRRVVRVKEFTNRFSRNYLYPLARQLEDLPAIHQINPMLVNQKLLSTYQIIRNALQAYQTYLPSSVGDVPYSQLKTLMGNIMGVCRFHRSLDNVPEDNYILEVIDSFKINAELTVQKVEEFVAKSEKKKNDGLKIEKFKIKLTKYGEEKTKTPSNKSKQDRLGMYSKAAQYRQDVPWRPALEVLARKKFNVKSKYRTATYKHRPPVQKGVKLMSIPKLKVLMHGKQPGILRSCEFDLPVNEDCIKTMVESEEGFEKENKIEDKGEETLSTKEEVLVKFLQFILKSYNNKTAPGSEKDTPISDILHLVTKEENDGLLKKVVNSLLEENSEQTIDRENNENIQQLTLNVLKSNYSLSDGVLDGKSKKKEPKITVTGDKNARLICIIDDNSLIEPSEAVRKSNELATTAIAKTSSDTQTDVKEDHNKTSKATQKGKHVPNIKISRLRKTEKPLKFLEKKVAVNAVQYKLDFYRFCKNNPMYKRSTTCQPWVLMGKLSEDLLNHCFLSVAREIEINEIVNKVFQSELQL